MTDTVRLGWRLVFLLAVCPAATGRAAVPVPASSAPPNVIFFLIDDLGWNDLGYTGGTFYESPNIDRLARRGVVFTRMYAAPICSPSRASLLTGLDPARTGMVSPRGDDSLEVLQAHVQPRIYTEQELKKERRKLPGGMQAPPKKRTLQVVSVSRLSTDYRSIARLFGANGYRTAHFGKWHVGPTPYSPLEHGFDVNEPRVNTPGPLKPGHFGPWPDWPGEEGPANNAAQIDAVLAKHAVRFIHENKDRPFFLNFWTYGVHIPWQAKKETIEHFRAKVASGTPGNAVHAAMIKHTDDAIGQVWQAVEAAGVAEKTIVVSRTMAPASTPCGTPCCRNGVCPLRTMRRCAAARATSTKGACEFRVS